MNFEERKNLFQEELTNIMNKYDIDIYPANVVMPSGEVMPMIKMGDTKKETTKEEELTTKEDGDTTKK
jgi:hypothetical protein